MYMVCSKLFGKAEIWTANKDSRGVHVCRYTLTHKLLDGCTLMLPENIEKLKASMSRSYYQKPKPFEA